MTLWQPGMVITASRMQDATPWIPLTSVGAYLNGAGDGSVQPMVRDVYVRDEVNREFKGVVNTTGVTTSNYVFFQFTSSYIPTYERNWGGAGFGPTAPWRLFLSTAGNWGLSGQQAGVTSIRLDQFEIKNASGTLPV
ncbi:hypothetical protein [Streptomyces griseoluteus]|uniref:hypothetical protein n=1 Tax=Streptomyces griseoluteus TaxID=29306 RepID=UPI00364B4403